MKRSAEAVLLFGLTKEQAARIETALNVLKVRVRLIGEESCQAPIGLLAIGSSPAESKGEALAEPVLVFCGLSDRKLERALAVLRDSSLPKIGLKAVLTAQNSQWDIFTLYRELCSERAQFEK